MSPGSLLKQLVEISPVARDHSLADELRGIIQGAIGIVRHVLEEIYGEGTVRQPDRVDVDTVGPHLVGNLNDAVRGVLGDGGPEKFFIVPSVDKNWLVPEQQGGAI